MWLGDHRQTPGGLRKSAAARRFRRKLLQRPLGLRGNSIKVQPNTLHQVVCRYLTGTPSSPAYPVAQLMAPDLLLPQNSQEHLENLAKELLGAHATWQHDIVPRTALAVLWLAIVHGIFDLHHAAYTPPPLPGLLTHPRFWHAHLNHACTRAVSPLAGAGTTDNMAGDQLAIWNQVSVGSNAPIPSTHLTIFVPPALGAFILANLKSLQGESPQLRPVTPSQPHSSSVLTASRPFHLDLPVIYPEHEDLIMDNARQAAATGFIRPESIPLLAITDESFYRGKLSWTLRFPVPAPDPSGSARRFSSTVTFQQGPHSAEALEGALRLASPFSYGNEASHVLFNCPFLRLPDLSTLRPGPRIDTSRSCCHRMA